MVIKRHAGQAWPPWWLQGHAEAWLGEATSLLLLGGASWSKMEGGSCQEEDKLAQQLEMDPEAVAMDALGEESVSLLPLMQNLMLWLDS